jgi:hypothetical protein
MHVSKNMILKLTFELSTLTNSIIQVNLWCSTQIRMGDFGIFIPRAQESHRKGMRCIGDLLEGESTPRCPSFGVT